MRVGLMVPHFGEHASRSLLLDSAQKAEALGFRSFWVRDHLLWEPHASESPDTTFVEPFVTLAAIAAVTTRCTLGTSVAIPVRWPLKLAQDFAGVAFVNGGRVIAGVGLGHNPLEFAAAGLRAEEREAIFRDTTQILRRIWGDEERVTFDGEVFSFEGVDIRPKPPEPIPLVYGGKTPAAVRRALAFTDGWNPGGLPLATLRRRLDYMRAQAGEERTAQMHKVLQPQVSVASTRERAEQRIPLEEILQASEGSRFYELPSSGSAPTVADVEGLVACGTADDIAEQLARIAAHGVDEVILDLRLQFEEYDETVELLGREVLPALGDLVDDR